MIFVGFFFSLIKWGCSSARNVLRVRNKSFFKKKMFGCILSMVMVWFIAVSELIAAYKWFWNLKKLQKIELLKIWLNFKNTFSHFDLFPFKNLSRLSFLNFFFFCSRKAPHWVASLATFNCHKFPRFKHFTHCAIKFQKFLTLFLQEKK